MGEIYDSMKARGLCTHGLQSDFCDHCKLLESDNIVQESGVEDIDMVEQDQSSTLERENSDTSFESLLSERLNSTEFLETLKSFPDKYRDKAIGLSIEYNILHRDGFGFEDYLSELSRKINLTDKPNGDMAFDRAKAGLIIESIVKKLNIADLSTEDKEKRVLEYINEGYFENGYYFHGFNGAFEQHIREKGIHTDERMWEWDELSDISRIGSRVGIGMLLGWGQMNSEGKVYVADNLDNMYRYSVASPEWFAQFTSEGSHVPNKEPYDKKAYYRRDYDAARSNIELLIDRINSSTDADIAARKAYPRLTDDEQEKILDFFEKYWAKFCGEDSEPKIAMINRSAIQRNDEYKYIESLEDYRNKARSVSYMDPSFSAYVASRVLVSLAHDTALTDTVPPGEIQIVSLPAYHDVHVD